MKTKRTLIQEFYDGWIRRDWPKVRALLTDDFRFSSPVDKKIDIVTYEQKCWPLGAHSTSFTLDQFMEDADSCLFVYTWHGKAGAFRAAEHARFRGEHIQEIDCFWGFLPQ
jgi:hypothetical protein